MPEFTDGPRSPDSPPAQRWAALRILDANFNRATEGLRVVEEYCRFALDDRHLTGLAKNLRHQVLAAIRSLPPEFFVVARNTEQDVGVTIPNIHAVRNTLGDIVRANLKRVEQALRSMEEYVKLVDPAVAPRLEALRYQTYTLAKACLITADSQQRLAGARLYVLLDGRQSESAFVERAKSLIGAGVHVLQLRDKRLDDRTLLARARLLRRVIDEAEAAGWRLEGGEETGVGNKDATIASYALVQPESRRESRSPGPRPPLFILNDRPDIALLARADGVHIGQEELSVQDVRQIVGPEMLMGVSTHNVEQARQAVLGGANYIGCGPTFPSNTKQFDRFPGLDFLRAVAQEISLPAFAIGGINRENVREVLATGFTRVAIGGAIATQADVAGEVASFLMRLGAAR